MNAIKAILRDLRLLWRRLRYPDVIYPHPVPDSRDRQAEFYRLLRKQ